MLVAPIDGVAYNSQSYQIVFSKYFRYKIWRICTFKIELNQNKYNFSRMKLFFLIQDLFPCSFYFRVSFPSITKIVCTG